RAHAAVEYLSGMGMGNGRQCTGAFLSEAFRLGDGAERTHSSNHAEGGRKRNFPHRVFDRFSAAASGSRLVPGANEGSGRAAARSAGSDRCELRAQASRPGVDRFHAGVIAYRRSRQTRHTLHKEEAMTMKTRKSSWIIYIAASMVLALAALPNLEKSIAAGPPTVDVKIDNFSFTPATLTVKAGTQITWTNGDDIPHTVVSDAQSFKSKVLDTDEKFTFTASKPGTYSYFCSIHPKMTGKVVVE